MPSSKKNVAKTCKNVNKALHLQQQTGELRSSDGLQNLKTSLIMKRDFLLPRGFKIAGWVLLITSAVMGIWSFTLDFDFERSHLLSTLLLEGPLLNNYIIIGLWLGAIFVGCSRERMEDEMIAHIRLKALLSGFYLQALFIILATLFVNSIDYLDVMAYNLVTYPLLFVVVYRWMLWRSLKSLSDEE